jgi:hypothetical protein
MKRDFLLKTICETAYNVGYAAKMNFATLDIVEKVPGFLGFISLAVGVYALIEIDLTTPHVGAAMVIVGIIAMYIALYQTEKQRYDDAGKQLTSRFNSLKKLYLTAKSRAETDDLSDLIAQHDAIQAETVNMSPSKQILFSDWYAHYKFFWQQQIDWIEEQKSFGFFRDKVPLTAWFTLVISAIVGVVVFAKKTNFFACLS